MRISEVARLTGITVRTLHYYDEIGLLRPSEVTEAGYRVYSQADLETLQQILFFRELDFPLSDIREIMGNPAYDKAHALRKHRELLLHKRSRIDQLLALVEKTIKGEMDMSFKQFDASEMEATRKAYAEEARQRWGGTAAYAEYEQRAGSRRNPQDDMLNGEGAAILQAFGQNRHLDPASPEAMALVKKWQAHITQHYYTCTLPILACLGQMYVGDERFTHNIDQYGEGTAAFMAAAIEAYCQEKA